MSKPVLCKCRNHSSNVDNEMRYNSNNRIQRRYEV